MRLLLAIAGLVAAFHEVSENRLPPIGCWILFTYLVYGVGIYILSIRPQSYKFASTFCYLDIAWFSMVVFNSGERQYLFFPMFLFAVFDTSFRCGSVKGTRVTLLCTAICMAAATQAVNIFEYAQFIVGNIFLLVFGLIAAYWGGSEVSKKRRLIILRRVAQIANPRFGVEQTLAQVLESTRQFFDARSCLLITTDKGCSEWTLRKTREGEGAACSLDTVDERAAMALFPPDNAEIVVFNIPRFPRFMQCRKNCRRRLNGRTRWQFDEVASAGTIAELLDTRSYMSISLPLRNGSGRLFVLSKRKMFSCNDGLSLMDIAMHAFPVIETIEVLDRLASQATVAERERIARDLHDSAVQSYIGLKHGIVALHMKAKPDNPLYSEIEQLIVVAGEVISELRRFTESLARHAGDTEAEFIKAIRRQADQTHQFYGIEVTLRLADHLHMSDRLSAEVFQIVSEGISNIRRHTRAHSGTITLEKRHAGLHICIANDHLPDTYQIAPFIPRSISERAGALGGQVEVKCTTNETAVLIDIPL